MKSDKRVLQLKITLNDITPAIWRRFSVEDSITFKNLHKIIQGVMGWEDYHMYEFNIGNEKIAPEEDGFNHAEAMFRELHNSPEFIEVLQQQDMSKGHVSIDPKQMNQLMQKIKQDKAKSSFTLKTRISKLITSEKQAFTYTYDFGDSWEHEVIVEKIIEPEEGKKYPFCTDGERSCPPEDCGSMSGYYDLMRIRKNKNHPEYKRKIVEWLGEDYDPELFIIDWVNARLHGKRPVPLWVNKKLDEQDDSGLLGSLLREDNDSIKQMKTLFNKEEEYEDYLGAIEFTIANYFLEHRNLKDKDVERIIKNLKKNYLQNIDLFETELEREIIDALCMALQEKSITPHELRLIFDYILWSIDNRTWVPDKQAFVKWLPYFFELYEDKEMRNYHINLTKIARRMGVPHAQIDMLLNRGETEIDEGEKDKSKIESQFFSLHADEKFNFIVENGLLNPYLVQSYILELDKTKEFETVERLCKKLMEQSNNFPMFEFLLGLNYNCLKNPILAKHHMENAVRTIEECPANLLPAEEREKMLQQMKAEIRRMS
ncbi:plasmid pRiA4b ORF-3 family protein [Candidatus Woesearchaeota archaeon]|nr:plasmid pRiA4b ORF-3 family protein [Candidatus Woesearchaeota archaeon]